jgi:ribonuclease HII
MARHSLSRPPLLPIETEARGAGYRRMVGLDEAGRGPLAGPVVAAAVLLPAKVTIPGLHDSKRLTPQQRLEVYERILQRAVSYGIGLVSPQQIDRYNVLRATQEAMVRAVLQLAAPADLLLIDGTHTIPLPVAQRTLIQGDARCASIAAASVLAKVTRDRLMDAYAQRYPQFGFDRHKGYPTREHYRCLRRYGPCAIHRLSFRGVSAP